MTNVEQGSSGGMGQKAQETAQDLSLQAREQVRGASGEAAERMREQVDQQSTKAGESVVAFSDATRRVGEQLRGEGKDAPARMAELAAERMERLGGYLRDRSGDEILRDVEDFGRRQPAALAAGGLLVGLVAARFLKASAHDRYRAHPARGPATPPRQTMDPGLAPYGGVPQPPRPDTAIDYPAASGL